MIREVLLPFLIDHTTIRFADVVPDLVLLENLKTNKPLRESRIIDPIWQSPASDKRSLIDKMVVNLTKPIVNQVTMFKDIEA